MYLTQISNWPGWALLKNGGYGHYVVVAHEIVTLASKLDEGHIDLAVSLSCSALRVGV